MGRPIRAIRRIRAKRQRAEACRVRRRNRRRQLGLEIDMACYLRVVAPEMRHLVTPAHFAFIDARIKRHHAAFVESMNHPLHL